MRTHKRGVGGAPSFSHIAAGLEGSAQRTNYQRRPSPCHQWHAERQEWFHIGLVAVMEGDELWAVCSRCGYRRFIDDRDDAID